ncbi:MAG: hypothetical protein LBJ00_08670 [Planctomycetaceae bacterium]|nr:hypothetical protein [Planctomycetaceae bacterium]
MHNRRYGEAQLPERMPKNTKPRRGEIMKTQAVLKFLKLNTQTQQRETVTQGRSLSPYRLRYK